MKTQMKFQKAVALISLIMAALSFVYALIFMTDISSISGYTTQQNGSEAFKGADDLYTYANGVTDVLLILAIVFLLISVTLYITASQKRRNYYITNYISIIATAVMAAVVAIAGIVIVTLGFMKYNAIDHDKYLELHNTWKDIMGHAPVISETEPEIDGIWSRKYPIYSDSPAMFIIGYVVNVLVLCVSAMNVLNLIWKTKLMKGEKTLLEQSAVREVA